MELQQFKTINAQELKDTILSKDINAVVKLCSSWSGSSHLLGYALSSFADRYIGQVDFYQIDIDDEPELTETYRVELVPTLLFFKRGKLVDKLSGLTPRNTISARIDMLVSNN
jgi:thioredoxin 1